MPKTKTTIETETKPTTKKAAKAEKAPKAKTKAVEAVAAPVVVPVDPTKVKEREVAGEVAAVMATYEVIDRPTEHGQVALAELLVINALDSRAAPVAALDAPFLDSLKNPDGTPHLIESVVAAWVRETATGRVCRVMVAGRRRRAGFEALGFTSIETTTKSYPSIAAILADSGVENLHRKNVSAYDKAVYFARLKAAGMKQKDIAATAGVTDSAVSMTLKLLTLDARVQKLVSTGKFGAAADTLGRELATVEDGDVQYAIAVEVCKDPKAIWTVSELVEYIKDMREKEAAKARKAAERAKAKKEAAKRGEGDGAAEEAEPEAAGPAYHFDPETFEPVEARPLGLQLERVYGQAQAIKERTPDVAAQVKELKAKYADALAYVMAQGHMKGLKEALGLDTLPKAVLTEAAVVEANDEAADAAKV